MARKPTDEVHLKLRFSEALRKKLVNSAVQSRRSLNAEIIHRLEQSFETPPVIKNFIEQTVQAVATAVVEGKFQVVGRLFRSSSPQSSIVRRGWIPPASRVSFASRRLR